MKQSCGVAVVSWRVCVPFKVGSYPRNLDNCSHREIEAQSCQIFQFLERSQNSVLFFFLM